MGKRQKRAKLLRKRPYLLPVMANLPLIGKVAVAHVYHDDDCSIWRGGGCDCDFQVVYEYPNLRGGYDRPSHLD